MRLKNKISIITGGATGIGSATAELFAAEGAKVVIGDINETEANATVDRIREVGGEAIFVPTNVAVSEEINRLVQSAMEAYGGIDILHNNAAYQLSTYPVTETTEEEWDKSINTNLRSVYLACKATIPHMIKQGGGSIINTASVLGVVGASSHAAYIASKGAIVQLTRSLAIDYGKQGIRANSLCPGITASPPANEALSDPEVYKQLVGMSVLGRVAECKEIACGALFLASDEASYVTGTCLFVDGGWTCQ